MPISPTGATGPFSEEEGRLIEEEVAANKARGIDLNPDVVLGNIRMRTASQPPPAPAPLGTPPTPQISPLNVAGAGETPGGATSPPITEQPPEKTPELEFLEKELAGAGMSTSGDFAALVEQEKAATAAVKKQTSAGFERERGARAKLGEKELGVGKALTAREGGTPLPAGSVELTFLQNIEKETQSAIEDLSQRERQALAIQDQESVRRIQDIKFAEIARLDKVQAQKRDLAFGLLQERRQQQTLDITRKEKESERAKANLELLVKQKVRLEDIPPESLRAFETKLDLPSGTGAAYFRGVEAAQKEKDSKDFFEREKSRLELFKNAFDVAENLDPNEEIDFNLPDGSTIFVQGSKEVNRDWKETKVQKSDGQYLVFTDKTGTVRAETRIADNYVAPYFDSDTQEWKTYDFKTNKETSVFNPGQYQEGISGMATANAVVQNDLQRRFGQPTQEPGGGFSHQHLTGWDFSAPAGSPLNSPDINGLVVKTGKFSGTLASISKSDRDYGNFVDIMDVDTGAQFRYAHLSNVAVKQGDAIRPGQFIGATGNTGFSTAPHLHFEVRDSQGRVVTPNRMDTTAGKSVSLEPLGAPSQGIIEAYNEEHPGANLIPKSRKDRQVANDWWDKKITTARQEVKDNRQFAFDLKKDLRQQIPVQNYEKVRPQVEVIELAGKRLEENLERGFTTVIQDQTIITALNKILDPNSVVREAEFDRTTEGQSILQRFEAIWKQSTVGGVKATPETLKEAVTVAKEYLDGAYKKDYQATVSDYVDQAQRNKVDPRDVVGTNNTPPVTARGSDGNYYEISPKDDQFLDAFLIGLVNVGEESIAPLPTKQTRAPEVAPVTPKRSSRRTGTSNIGSTIG